MYTPLTKSAGSFNFETPVNVPSRNTSLDPQDSLLLTESPFATRSHMSNTHLRPCPEGDLFQEMAAPSYSANGCPPCPTMFQGTWQDRERAMEIQIVRLTTERDTMKFAFEMLANAVQFPQADTADPLQFNMATLKPSLTSQSSRPTPEMHPAIRFWTQEDWHAWLMSPEAGQNPRGRYGYLEDDEGKPPIRTVLKEIRKRARGTWEELLQWNLAPKTWGKLGTSGRELFHHIMEKSFPLFTFANDGWKLDHLASTTYSAWYTRRFNADGSVKPRGKRIKTEDESSEDEDETEGQSVQKGKRMKKSLDTVEVSSAHKTVDTNTQLGNGDTISNDGLYLTTCTTTQMTTRCIEAPAAKNTIETPTNIPEARVMQMEDINTNKENVAPCGTSEMPTKKIIADPLLSLRRAGFVARESATHTTTAGQGVPIAQEPKLPQSVMEPKTNMPPPSAAVPTNPIAAKDGTSNPPFAPSEKPTTIPPTPAPVEVAGSSIVPFVASPPTSLPALPPVPVPVNSLVPVPVPAGKSTKPSGSKKMRVSPTKNGRNLCVLRWKCKLNPNGTTEEFQLYYKELCPEQRKAYDEEASKLVHLILSPGLPFGCPVRLIYPLQVASDAWVKDSISEGTVY